MSTTHHRKTAPESYPGTAHQIVYAPDDEHHHKHEEQGARDLSQCFCHIFAPSLTSEPARRLLRRLLTRHRTPR